MQKFVAEQNIHLFKALLTQEADEARQEVLLRMIAEEEAKLAEAIASPKSPSNLDSSGRNPPLETSKTVMIAGPPSSTTGSAEASTNSATSP